MLRQPQRFPKRRPRGGITVTRYLLLCLGLLLAPPAQAADRASLTGQHIVGYQGWFACPGDGRPFGNWVHWFDVPPHAAPRVTVDMLPDVRDLAPEERCPTPWRDRLGRPVALYSAQRPATVARHFAWMAEHGIGVAAAGRFGVGLTSPAAQAPLDRVLDNIRAGAEAHGRGFFVAYDISGMRADQFALLVADWRALRARGLTASPAYQNHQGRPVLLVWGLGFRDRPGDADQALALLAALRAVGPVTLVGGVPAGWRTLDADSKPEPSWAAVYRSFEVLSPWTVGRYADAPSINAYRESRLEPDLALTRARGQGFLPVIFPGFTWANLVAARGGRAPHNAVPRRCGAFYWDQARTAGQAGAEMLFTAMFDEVDEGTAIFKLAPTPADLPEAPVFTALDADGCRLPSDWYLRIAAQISARIGTRNWPDRLPMLLPGGG